jgi:hypothetical protein
MKKTSLLVAVILIAAMPGRADTAAYAHCGTYDGYILLYKSTQRLEELGKLRCGEEVSVTSQSDDYSQVRTADGRLGWVLSSDLSTVVPPPQETFTFELTAKHELHTTPQPGTPREQPVAVPVSAATPLITNVNVMKMQGDRSSPDAIIAKINASRCDFDTSPAGIHRLKLSGVSDRIVLAMMHVPPAFPAVPPDAAATVETTIPDGLPIEVAFSGDLASDGLREGTVIEMSVVHDVTLEGLTVFRSGAQARARVMAVRRAGMGNSGEVIWFMQDIQAVTGDRIPANFAATQDGKTPMGNFSGYPYFISEFRKNAPAIAAAGDQFTAVVTGNMALRIPRPAGADQAAAKPAPQPGPQAAAAATAQTSFPALVQAPEQQAAVKP